MAVQTISYTDKVALNENSSIADINKIKDDDMNEIKNVVNNNATETGNNSTDIDNLQIYSTTETNTGKVWIDGKTIYRRVMTYNNVAVSNGTQFADRVSSQIDTVTSLQGMMKEETNQRMLPLISAAGKTNGIRISADGYIVWSGDDTWSAENTRTYYIIVEYTKTS